MRNPEELPKPESQDTSGLLDQSNSEGKPKSPKSPRNKSPKSPKGSPTLTKKGAKRGKKTPNTETLTNQFEENDDSKKDKKT